MKVLRNLGQCVNVSLNKIGKVTDFIISIFLNLVTPPIYGREILKAFYQIGWMSLPVLGLTALFTGGALALQIYAGGSRFNAEQVVPAIVAIGMARELGPVLGGLIVAARVASSHARKRQRQWTLCGQSATGGKSTSGGQSHSSSQFSLSW